MAAHFSFFSAVFSGLQTLLRKALPFSKAKEMRQQSADARQNGHRFRKSCSVFSLVNYANFSLQSTISLLQLFT